MAGRPPGRDRSAALAAVAAMAVIAAFVAGKAARDAILLSTFPVTRLPLFVGVAAVVSLPLILIAGRLIARWGPGRVLPALNVASAILLAGEWLVLGRWPRLGAAASFVHLGALGAVLVSGFWSIVSERFDPRTARRHIGRIGVGATIGGIAGGVIAERASVWLAPEAILLVLAALQLVCAGALRALGRGGRRQATAVEPVAPWAAIRTVTGTPLLRNLALVVTLGAVAAAALDYVFKARVTASAGAGGALRFFAIYHTVANVITAVVQIALGRAVITRLGVGRGVAALPATVTVFGLGALVVPGLAAAVIARGAEMITRSSIYRAAYELVYGPLPEHQKRATKVVLDVGAERVGDLLGAQLVGALLWAAAPASALIGLAVAAGAGALWFALRLPRSYTTALEHGLVARAGHHTPPAWSPGPPTLTEAGDLTAISLLSLPGRPTSRGRAAAVPDLDRPPARERDPIADRVAALRSGDPVRVRAALVADLDPELAAHVIPLLAWDEVAPAATAALRAIAARATGVLVDALLDPDQEFSIRRRLPGIVEHGAPALASWGLWRAIGDPRFEVRYRCGKALARIRAAGHEVEPGEDAVIAAIRRELAIDGRVRDHHHVIGPGAGDDRGQPRLSRAVDHVLVLVGLALPPEPGQIALHGLAADDRVLRALAIEYLDSALPADIRARLVPLIESDPARPPPRDRVEVAIELRSSHAALEARATVREWKAEAVALRTSSRAGR